MKEGERLRLRRVENPGVVIDAVANQVRPFKAREELVEVPAESDEYEVQQILCEAQLKGGRHYLVQYAGFPDKKDWWQPESSIPNANPILQAFKQRPEADRMPAGKSIPKATKIQRGIAAYMQGKKEEAVKLEERSEKTETDQGEGGQSKEKHQTTLPTEIVSTRSGRAVRPNRRFRDGIGNFFAILAAPDRGL